MKPASPWNSAGPLNRASGSALAARANTAVAPNATTTFGCTSVEPPPIALDLARRAFLVNAPFSTLLEFEVFDGIRDVDTLPIDACLGHGPIQELAGRSHEWPTLPILLITRLFAHEGD
jgi:hypothetical protein